LSDAIERGGLHPGFAGEFARPTIALRTVPLWLLMSYLCATFALFMIWPINWPIYSAERWLILVAYVALCYLVITIFYLFGTRPGPTPRPFEHWLRVIIAGSVAAIVTLFPSSYLYSGRWPWEVMGALADQGEAYRSLQHQLFATAGERGPVAFMRALVAPLTFAVLPLGVIHWRELGNHHRALVVATVMCSIIFSILRGTDREMADIFIVGGSALLIAIARQGQNGGGLVLIRRFWKPAVMILVFLAIAFSLFTERKTARLSGIEQREMICANDSRICADIDAPYVSWMTLSQRFGISTFILSTSSGFYGLELALEKDFQSTFGVGHSTASLAVYELITGDEQLETRTYTYRNGVDGWNQENYWSSLVTWIANDVGFTGAVVVLGLLGFLWGRLWRDATYGHNDSAAVLFGLIMIMLVYLPANNQVFGSYEGYTVFFVWLALWLRQRRVRVIL
jgi:hypothetical protein